MWGNRNTRTKSPQARVGLLRSAQDCDQRTLNCEAGRCPNSSALLKGWTKFTAKEMAAMLYDEHLWIQTEILFWHVKRSNTIFGTQAASSSPRFYNVMTKFPVWCIFMITFESDCCFWIKGKIFNVGGTARFDFRARCLLDRVITATSPNVIIYPVWMCSVLIGITAGACQKK